MRWKSSRSPQGSRRTDVHLCRPWKCRAVIDYETGEPWTAHTTNPVPFILVNYDDSVKLREGGCLADIAPTLLEIMGLPQPEEMTGKSLIVR